MIECSLKSAQPERTLGQQIPVKRLHVPYIKDNAVSLGNWSVVHRFFANHAKQFVGARACAKQSAVEVMPDVDSSGYSSHGDLPFPWMRRPREGCAKFQRRGARWIKMVPLEFVAVNRNEY